MERSILIKNGRIWDGKRFFYADLLTEGGKIAKIDTQIEESVDFCYDASGQIVSAGFVDAHVHFRGISPDIYGISAEAACFPFGVTAAVDVAAVQPSRATAEACAVKNKVLAFVSAREDKLHTQEAEQGFSVYGERVIGVKFPFSMPDAVSVRPLEEACVYARSKNLPLMVHCTGSPVSMAQIVTCLSPGDIITHPYHGGKHTAAEDDFACLKQAKEKGIWLDAGFAGHVHTDFAVLRNAMAAGIFPDTISTDITRLSAFQRGGRYGMTMTMGIARTAGMPEEAIFRAITTAPAEIWGQPWGRLQVGGVADIAVLDYCDESFCFTDAAGNIFEDTRDYRCKLTVADGAVVFRD